jgi:hypothetical protein
LRFNGRAIHALNTQLMCHAAREAAGTKKARLLRRLVLGLPPLHTAAIGSVPL